MSVSNGDSVILNALKDDEVSISVFRKAGRRGNVTEEECCKAFPVLTTATDLRMHSQKGSGARHAGANLIATVPVFTKFRDTMRENNPDNWTTDMFLVFGSHDGKYSMKVYFPERAYTPKVETPVVETVEPASDNFDDVVIVDDTPTTTEENNG